MGVPEEQLDRGQGSGSRSAMEDEKTGDIWETKDERADTNTTFYARDIDRLNVSERRKKELRRMLDRQEGQDYGESYSEDRNQREQQNRTEWKRRVAETYGSQLDLTTAQKQRVEHLVMDVVEMSTFMHSGGSFSVEQIVLGVINVVARENGRWIEDEDQFRALLSEVGIQTDDGRPDMDLLKQLRARVRERVPSR